MKKTDGYFFLNGTTHMQTHAHIHAYSTHVHRTSIHISEALICIKNEEQHKLKETFKKYENSLLLKHYETTILTQNISL